MPSGPRAPSPAAWGWYPVWMLLGAVAAVALVATFTPLVLLVPIVGLLGARLATRSRARGAWPALICGLALPVAFVAWLNRGGPGEVCTSSAGGGQSCVDEWSPWPWLGVALVLIGLGVGLSVVLRRRVAQAQARDEAATTHRIGTELPPRS